jgi:hypothetical protein
MKQKHHILNVIDQNEENNAANCQYIFIIQRKCRYKYVDQNLSSFNQNKINSIKY